MEPWFNSGLKFKCTSCGKCCTGKDGVVVLSKKDIENLSQHLKMGKTEFIETFTKQFEGYTVLLDQENLTADCIFLNENKCSVYENRPVQCKTFPWWISQIRSKAAWDEAKKHCEGIDHPEAPTVGVDEILSSCQTNLDNLIEENFT
jgi:Fe-S-cluster containining protein